MRVRLRKLAQAAIEIAVLLALLSHAPIAAAEGGGTTSITTYPAKTWMTDSRQQITLSVVNTGDTTYTATVAASVPWLALSATSVKVKPGQTAKLTVKVVKAKPHGAQSVSFTIPAPGSTGGVAARGGVAAVLDFRPSPAAPVTQAPGPSTDLPWPWAAGAFVLLVGTYAARRFRGIRSP
jgi:hypothetical protein